MKRSTKKLTKMQRRVRSRRKTWTNVERFEHRNARAMKDMERFEKAMKKFQAQMLANQPAATPVESVEEPVVEETPTINEAG